MSLSKGDLLRGRYRILASLGLGGMGAVYKAFDESLKVDVAVKENLFITKEYAVQFRTEAEILASLRHPNLPRVTDYFVVNNIGQYLVMDFIEGEDLRQHMENHQFITEEQAIQIGVGICDALSYMHSRKPPVLHRDIKPGNVRISKDGQVYLVDFGLAKRVEGENEQTYTGAQAMTPGYSPPEQYGSARTDVRTDIYSLGATLYAGLTGVIPEDSLMRAVDGDKLPPLRKHNPKITPRLEAVILKAMAIQPASRYQTADELKKAFLSESESQPTDKQAAANLQTAQPKDSQPRPARPKTNPKKRQNNLIGPIVFALILLIGAAGFFLFSDLIPGSARAFIPFLAASSTPQPTAATQLPTATQTITPLPSATATLTPTITATASVVPQLTESLINPPTEVALPTATRTPTPPQVLFASQVDSTVQLFIRLLDETEAKPLINIPDGACQPDWSPDGTKIVFVSPCVSRQDFYPKANLYILNLESNLYEAMPLAETGNFEPNWSPDGSQIVFTSLRDGRAQLYLFNFETTTETRLTNTAIDVIARQAVWSLDGTKLYFAMRRFGLYQIWQMDADGQNQNQLIRSGGSTNDFLPAVSTDGSYLLFSQTGNDVNALPRLMRFALDGSQLLPSRVILAEPITDIDFSPNGQWIAYEGSNGSNQDIYLYNLETGRAQRWTNNPQAEFDPVWRP